MRYTIVKEIEAKTITEALVREKQAIIIDIYKAREPKEEMGYSLEGNK